MIWGNASELYKGSILCWASRFSPAQNAYSAGRFYGIWQKHLHIDVRDYFLIDNVSYTEVKTSLRDMEKIQRCHLALDMLDDLGIYRMCKIFVNLPFGYTPSSMFLKNTMSKFSF
jgi:hypothetical protein